MRKLDPYGWDMLKIYGSLVVCWVIAMVIIGLLVGVLAGCQTAPGPGSSAPVADLVEKLDLKVEINGQELPGWGVAPAATKYTVKITPSQRIGRIQWRTCDRSDEIDRGSSGFFGDWWGNQDTTFEWSYIPDPLLDQKHFCPLEIDVLTPKKEYDAFAVIDFTDKRPEYTIMSTLTCNGERSTQKGVAMCQSREGLMQSISFDQPVVAKGLTFECDVMKDVDGKQQSYRFAIGRGKCLYTFVAEARAANGERLAFRLFTHGYNDVPVRN